MNAHAGTPTLRSGHSGRRLRARLHAIPTAFSLAAGIVAFVLYLAMDFVAALAYDGYSYRDQAISELSAVDAPTRTFWVICGFVWQAVMFVFAFGLLRAAGGSRRVRIVGYVVLAMAFQGFIWFIAPMHQREALAAGGGDWRDTLHLALGGVASVLAFTAIVAGAWAFGRAFRWYSFATLAAFFTFGALMGMDGGKIAEDEATPWFGIYERANIFAWMLWLAVLGVLLIRSPREAPVAQGRRQKEWP
jgi:hypothetical protein